METVKNIDYSVGERVRVRDTRKNWWKYGVVTKAGVHPKVKPDDFEYGYQWNEVEYDDSKPTSTHPTVIEKNLQPLVSIIVKDVPTIPVKEQKEFKTKYINNTKVHDEKEMGQRRDNVKDIMFARWDWVQKNPEIYVNELRLSGFSDEAIQACLNGDRPLCFISQEIYDEFLTSLRSVKSQLEKETGWKNMSFVQTGSSVVGYSGNPLKGFENTASKITSTTSDVDIVVLAGGIEKTVQDVKDKIRVKEYPAMSAENGETDLRYGFKPLTDFSSLLAEFNQTWTEKLEGGIQFTFQREADPKLPPWERNIPI